MDICQIKEKNVRKIVDAPLKRKGQPSDKDKDAEMCLQSRDLQLGEVYHYLIDTAKKRRYDDKIKRTLYA